MPTTVTRSDAGTVTMSDERADIDLAKVWLPGIHYGVTFDEYRSLPYLNSSSLTKGIKSALHLKTALDGGYDSQDTDDTLFGSALHARVLEPDKYAERYVLAPGCQAILQSGKAKGCGCGKTSKYLVQGEWLCGTHTPTALVASGLIERQKDILTHDQAVRIEGAAKSVTTDSVVKLIRMPGGGFEATILFEWDGIKCKSRIDKLVPRTEWNPPTILDLKKVQREAADDTSVERSIERYAYHAQAAFYHKAVSSVMDDVVLFYWIFVEDSPPHAINVIQADPETLQCGEFQLSDCFTMYRHGLWTGEWPGHNDRSKPKLGGLSQWAKNRILGR